MKTIAIGVDIGGIHISCAACDLAEKRFLPRTLSENGLDNQGTAGEIIEVWAKTIGETFRKTGLEKISGIGFAMPGPFDYVNGIAMFKGNNKKYESLFGLNVSEALRAELNLPKDFPIRFINDATAFALGEDWIGKARGTKKSLSITLGTGFGSAFINDHMPVVSGDEVPELGCVYHLPFEQGNADDYFSTRGLLKRYYSRTNVQLSGVKDLAGLVPGDTTAKQLFDDFGHKLGLFLRPWIEKSGVEVLIIGGNISLAYNYFGESLQNSLHENRINIKVEISELRETASIIGGAVLVNDLYYDKVKQLLSMM